MSTNMRRCNENWLISQLMSLQCIKQQARASVAQIDQFAMIEGKIISQVYLTKNLSRVSERMSVSELNLGTPTQSHNRMA